MRSPTKVECLLTFLLCITTTGWVYGWQLVKEYQSDTHLRLTFLETNSVQQLQLLEKSWQQSMALKDEKNILIERKLLVNEMILSLKDEIIDRNNRSLSQRGDLIRRLQAMMYVQEK